jgi:hypothetical protein
MAGKPPAEAAQPPSINGIIVKVAINEKHAPSPPKIPNFLFQKPKNNSSPVIASLGDRFQIWRFYETFLTHPHNTEIFSIRYRFQPRFGSSRSSARFGSKSLLATSDSSRRGIRFH